MIVGDRKPFDEIKESVKECKKLLILGCGTCVSVCMAGGEKEVELLASELRMARKLEGNDVEIGEATIQRQCDREYIEPIIDMAKEYDGVLSMACGAGVQMMAEIYPDIPIYPAQNTMFMGGKIGDDYIEKCAGCGDCLLGYTGGICPIANCAKSMVNGPCGGPINKKCEVGDYTKPCAWIKIFEQLNSRPGGLELFMKFRTPVDFRIRTPPREYKEGGKIE